MLKQWEINEYRGETIKLTGDDLPGSGTYMLGVTFVSRRYPEMQWQHSAAFIVNK